LEKFTDCIEPLKPTQPMSSRYYSREALLDKFSSFIQFEDDRFGGWSTNPTLQRSMKAHLSELVGIEASAKYCSTFWYRTWNRQNHPLAYYHLVAYLQEPCYEAAQKLTHAKPSHANAQETLFDCFQYGIITADKILKRYNPATGNTLEKYARCAFSTNIRDKLRNLRERDGITDWTLLQKLGPDQLRLALRPRGLSEPEMAARFLTLICFQTAYTPNKPKGNQKREAPSPEIWESITQLYNRRRLELQVPAEAITASMLEGWLLECAQLERKRHKLDVLSLNAPISEDAEFGDFLPDQIPTPLDNAIAQQEREHLFKALAGALAELPLDLQQLLELRFGQDLNQSEIADRIGKNQATVSRKLKAAWRHVLEYLVRWFDTELHISIDFDILKNLSDGLEVWLIEYYSTLPDEPK
jgi:RNA polymerase sigma factor (sigma-70 family)